MTFIPGVGLITKLPYFPPLAMQVTPSVASAEVHGRAVKPVGTNAGRVFKDVSPYASMPWVILKGGADRYVRLGFRRIFQGSVIVPSTWTCWRMSKDARPQS